MEAVNVRLVRRPETQVYEIRWTERTASGYRSKRISTGTTSEREAQATLAGFLSGEEHAVALTAAQIVGDVLKAYRRALLSDKKGETQLICLDHLERELGSLRVPEVTPDRLLTYRRMRCVSDGTLRRELGALRAAFGYAVKHKALSAGDVPQVDLPRSSLPREVYLTAEQEPEFHALAMGHSIGQKRLTRLTRFVAIALDTAARKTAILQLTWDRVDFSAGVINFAVAGDQAHNKRRALVPISRRLRPILEKAYAERKSKYVLDSAGAIKTTWNRWIATTPYEHINPHDLRRSWATLAAQAGVPIVDIAQVLGDDPATVLKHYAKHVPGAALAAVNARF